MHRKQLANLIVIVMATTAAAWGCRKNTEEPAPSPAPAAPAGQSVFAQLVADNIADATRTFSVSAATGGQFMSPRGTQLDFEPGAFTYADGTPVTGSVTVSLVEALTMGDMIWLNKQTVGNDNGTLRILRSGGAINVYANQGSTPVLIADGALIARLPTNVGDPAMQLYRGSENNAGDMLWDLIPDGIVTVDSAYYDSTEYTYTFPYQFYYNLDANTDLNWINLDYYYNYPNTTRIEATLPAGQPTDSTALWLALPNLNGVVGMYYSTTTQSFTHGPVIPVGNQVVVVGLRQTATGYSSAFAPVTVSTGLVVPLTFTPTTLQQFHDDVNAL